jgi:hypothetical protein
MRASPDFAAKKCVNRASAGRNDAPKACIELTDACIRASQDSNAAVLSCIAALWDYLVPPPAYSTSLWACNPSLYSCNGPAQDNGAAVQDCIEAGRAFFAALQSKIATLLSFFWALRDSGQSMQARVGSMQGCNALDRLPFFRSKTTKQWR